MLFCLIFIGIIWIVFRILFAVIKLEWKLLKFLFKIPLTILFWILIIVGIIACI